MTINERYNEIIIVVVLFASKRRYDSNNYKTQYHVKYNKMQETCLSYNNPEMKTTCGPTTSKNVKFQEIQRKPQIMSIINNINNMHHEQTHPT